MDIQPEIVFHRPTQSTNRSKHVNSTRKIYSIKFSIMLKRLALRFPVFTHSFLQSIIDVSHVDENGPDIDVSQRSRAYTEALRKHDAKRKSNRNGGVF